MTIKTLPQWRNFAIGSREEVRQSQVSHDRVRYDLSKSCYANSRFQIENGERRYQREREKEREKIDEILFPFSVNLMNIFQILVRLVIFLSLSSRLLLFAGDLCTSFSIFSMRIPKWNGHKNIGKKTHETRPENWDVLTWQARFFPGSRLQNFLYCNWRLDHEWFSAFQSIGPAFQKDKVGSTLLGVENKYLESISDENWDQKLLWNESLWMDVVSHVVWAILHQIDPPPKSSPKTFCVMNSKPSWPPLNQRMHFDNQKCIFGRSLSPTYTTLTGKCLANDLALVLSRCSWSLWTPVWTVLKNIVKCQHLESYFKGYCPNLHFYLILLTAFISQQMCRFGIKSKQIFPLFLRLLSE